MKLRKCDAFQTSILYLTHSKHTEKLKKIFTVCKETARVQSRGKSVLDKGKNSEFSFKEKLEKFVASHYSDYMTAW